MSTYQDYNSCEELIALLMHTYHRIVAIITVTHIKRDFIPNSPLHLAICLLIIDYFTVVSYHTQKNIMRQWILDILHTTSIHMCIIFLTELLISVDCVFAKVSGEQEFSAGKMPVKSSRSGDPALNHSVEHNQVRCLHCAQISFDI